jgi:hypothetical protein
MPHAPCLDVPASTSTACRYTSYGAATAAGLGSLPTRIAAPTCVELAKYCVADAHLDAYALMTHHVHLLLMAQKGDSVARIVVALSRGINENKDIRHRGQPAAPAPVHQACAYVAS